MFTLETFGGLSLRGVDGLVSGRVSQRRRLALLAILAAERRPVSRDKLLALLWPEAETQRARHLLADSLYVLRAGLCEDALHTTGDDVSLNESRIASDVGAFLRAIAEEDPERAVGVYAGPFLDGIFISDSPEFERWSESARSRLAGERRRCLEQLASEAGGRRQHELAVKWWRELAAADPLSSKVACALIRALRLGGDRAAALQFARVHEAIVRAELDSPPDPAVSGLVAELRRATDESPAPSPELSAAPESTDLASTPAAQTVPRLPDPSPPFPPRLTTVPRRKRSVAISVVASTLLISVALVALIRARDTTTRVPVTVVSGHVATTPEPPSIAVLPFEPISSDREADYIADGVTDALTTALDRLHTMRIVSRTSAFVAKRSGLATPAIGDMLQARFLVEGSVRLAGNQMRIDARLIGARDGKLLWSQEFVRDFSPTPLIAVEETIARSIAVTLNVRLAEGSSGSLASSAPANTEAFDAYLRGRHLWNSRNPDGVRKAIAYFEQSIARDSAFAPAYAGLADAYATFAIGNIGDFRAEDYFPRARDAARRALALDSTLAEAHASLGYFELLYNLDWATAARELSRAIDLRPSYSTARIYRTVLLEWLGRFSDAVSEARNALRLDPLSLATNIELGRALFLARRYEEADRQLRLTLDLDSTSLRAHLHLGQVLAQQRRFDDAIAELTRAAELSAKSSRPLALLAHAYATAGKQAEALLLLDSLAARARRGYVPAFDFAIVQAGLGRSSHAIDWLNRAVQDHSIRPYLMDPTFDAIRAHSGYHALLARIGLPSVVPKPDS